MIRRVGEPVNSEVNYRVRPGVYGVLIRRGALLLTHQSEPAPEFQLPGGGIDAGESLIPALHREILEETGWRVGGVRRLGAFRRFTYMPEYDLWAEKICHIYHARPSYSLGPPTETGHRAVWVQPEVGARIVSNPGDAHFIRRAVGIPV